MTSSIQFGSRQIDFTLEYAVRKSLGITVTPDMRVLVKAPLEASMDLIKEKVKKRATWIIKQQSFFLSFHPKTPARRFVEGETHHYLGRQYRLKVEILEQEAVKLKGAYIEVHTIDKNKVKLLMERWYLENAKAKFNQIAKPIIERFKYYGVEPSSVVLRDMPTRWGSCTPKGKIILNPELIKAPKGCIEYVIIHELCHLVHHDHTNKFFDLQSQVMPDWEKWKDRLERLLA